MPIGVRPGRRFAPGAVEQRYGDAGARRHGHEPQHGLIDLFHALREIMGDPDGDLRVFIHHLVKGIRRDLPDAAAPDGLAAHGTGIAVVHDAADADNVPRMVEQERHGFALLREVEHGDVALLHKKHAVGWGSDPEERRFLRTVEQPCPLRKVFHPRRQPYRLHAADSVCHGLPLPFFLIVPHKSVKMQAENRRETEGLAVLCLP